jgi:hypothetical protein
MFWIMRHTDIPDIKLRKIQSIHYRTLHSLDKIIWDVNWFMIDYLRFYVLLKNFSLIWRRHHCRWRAANFGLCSALRAFEQGGIFIMPHLLWHGTSVFLVSSEGPPHLAASHDTRGDVEDLFLPESSRGLRCKENIYVKKTSRDILSHVSI